MSRTSYRVETPMGLAGSDLRQAEAWTVFLRECHRDHDGPVELMRGTARIAWQEASPKKIRREQ